MATTSEYLRNWNYGLDDHTRLRAAWDEATKGFTEDELLTVQTFLMRRSIRIYFSKHQQYFGSPFMSVVDRKGKPYHERDTKQWPAFQKEWEDELIKCVKSSANCILETRTW